MMHSSRIAPRHKRRCRQFVTSCTPLGSRRDRAFYPTVMIVIAAYYVLFAAMSGSVQTLVVESVVMTLFLPGS